MNSKDRIQYHVSRETFERFEVFVELLDKWTSHVNLISQKSRTDIWKRHIWDSLQLIQHIKLKGHWVDIGTGGGFPGLILSIFARQVAPKTRFTFIEKDKRKAAFLRTVVRNLSLDSRIISARIEDTSPLKANILSARALAELEKLLFYANRHLMSDGIALFPKGNSWKREVIAAKEHWKFDFQLILSETNENSVILKIRGIQRV
ncbi:MAG: 16S rRNA (guanine(527)-N(7))-methyltransferase RsmG [Aestuariivita sp.]|nr:16S rRNA (guanine(527)-N(7))-methyltransferase RsmG [Aestuariivita sp.]